MTVPLLAACMECRGNGEVCLPTRTVEGYDGPYRCEECDGLGVVLVQCAWPGCRTAAVRRSVGEPAVAYCEAHDLCPLCEQAPAGPEDYCSRCAADLTVVAPSTVGAAA